MDFIEFVERYVRHSNPDLALKSSEIAWMDKLLTMINQGQRIDVMGMNRYYKHLVQETARDTTLLKMKEGQRFAMVSPDGMYTFRLEKIEPYPPKGLRGAPPIVDEWLNDLEDSDVSR